MKESIKNKILNYLTEKRGWVYGGAIEDFIRQTDGHKASNASRRCRELEDEGKIERKIVKLGTMSVVQYRLNTSQTPETAPRQPILYTLGEYCCGDRLRGLESHAKDCRVVKVKQQLF